MQNLHATVCYIELVLNMDPCEQKQKGTIVASLGRSNDCKIRSILMYMCSIKQVFAYILKRLAWE